MKRPLQTKTRKLARHGLRSAVIDLNRRYGRFAHTVWIIGEGRSGTTWLGDLICSRLRYREMFEPFHPTLVSDFAFLGKHAYRRPGDDDERLEELVGKVFTGEFTHPWTDKRSSRILYDGLLIKDIFATLLAKWATEKFPWVKPVLLVRNPFSVARSKRERSDWQWFDRPAELLKQPKLVADHLTDKADILKSADATGNYIIRQIAIWAAVHHVIFRQFAAGDIHLAFYEDIVADTSGELSRLFKFVGKPDDALAHAAATTSEPSRVSTAESVALARENSWRDGLTADEIAGGRHVLAAFGLDRLYGTDGLPRRDALRGYAIGADGRERPRAKSCQV